VAASISALRAMPSDWRCSPAASRWRASSIHTSGLPGSMRTARSSVIEAATASPLASCARACVTSDCVAAPSRQLCTIGAAGARGSGLAGGAAVAACAAGSGSATGADAVPRAVAGAVCGVPSSEQPPSSSASAAAARRLSEGRS
jgi:hypothetical protein